MSDKETHDLRRRRSASLRERGYAAEEDLSLSLLAERRGIALPRSSWLSSTKIGTLEVQTVLPKRSRGPREALVWGWPTPIRFNARTELPPLLRKPVYGPAAREEARRLMREAKREKISFGWATKKSLCKVAKGERPLSYSVWHGAEAYVRRVQRQREHERDVRERSMQFRLVPGNGLVVGWRGRSSEVSQTPRVQDMTAKQPVNRSDVPV